jgi:hypothetical protein
MWALSKLPPFNHCTTRIIFHVLYLRFRQEITILITKNINLGQGKGLSDW